MPERGPIEFPRDVAPLAPTAEFLRACSAMSVEFDARDLERLGAFLALLLEANKAANLTAIRDANEAWMRHIHDALTLLPVLASVGEQGRAADVGSGGGLPGIPLAIALGEWSFTLIEATGKKAAFLRHAKEQLGLANVEVLCERAEVIGQDHRTHRAMYDVALARAVGGIAQIAELTVPLVKVGGQVLLVKGERWEQELAEAKQALHMLHVAHVETVQTATGRIVMLEKLRATPRDYPRAVGEPKRKPLGT